MTDGAPDTADPDSVTLFLCGDVMTGRGVDQALPHPGDPRLHESYITDARDYLALAEAAHGGIDRPLAFAAPWGDLQAELARRRPVARVINLETAVTTSDDWQAKGINYRMHPANLGVITALSPEVCVLANNHVLDWGEAGLLETLAVLQDAGLATAGVGRDAAAAAAPAVVPLPGGDAEGGGQRLLVFAFAHDSSGVPRSWAAGPGRPGVARLDDLSVDAAEALAERLRAAARPGDLVVVSLHWGGNRGFEVPRAQRDFAGALVAAGVDLVHGHSSHHPRAAEVRAGRAILYGCGDLLNDYEGIGGYEEFRGDLALAWFATLARADGRLLGLEMVPFRLRRLRLQRARGADARWLAETLDRECRRLGGWVELTPEETLRLRW